MSDLDAGSDGSVFAAGDAIGKMLLNGPDNVAAPMETPKPDRPRGPDGKYLSAKKPEDDAPIPLTGQDGTDADVEPAEEPAEPEAEEVVEEEAEESEPAPLPQKVRVKVDGLEQEVPLDEVVKGYSRTADYTRKTQALAEERKRFEAEELTPVREERRVYAERLATLQEAVQALLPDREPDWNTLRNTLTPEQFQDAFAEYKVQSERVQRIKSERDRIHAIEQADTERALQARLISEHEKLKQAIPEFADEAKGKQLKEDLVAYAKSAAYNFTDDDLAQVTDSRVLVLLNKARLWDESQLRKPKVEAKIDRALETMKPSNAKSKPKMSEIAKLNAQLKSTGRVEDAAAILNRML